jgi:hypothetical protein
MKRDSWNPCRARCTVVGESERASPINEADRKALGI